MMTSAASVTTVPTAIAATAPTLVPRRQSRPPESAPAAPDQDVVGHGQRRDHVLQCARDEDHDDPEAGDVEAVAADVVVLAAGLDVAAPQPRDDVLAEHGRSGDQRPARRGHHRGRAAASTRPASTGGNCVSTNSATRRRGLERRQQHLGRHADHRPATAYSGSTGPPRCRPSGHARLRAVDTRCQMSWPMSSPNM